SARPSAVPRSSSFQQKTMYDNYRNPHPPGMQMPPPNPQPGPYDNPLYGASSGLIKTGLGVYGEKFLGSSSEFMQSNISRYFSNPQYYFHVNDQYVRNKLKVILFPFLHRGHWTRISEPVGGRLSYKPPMYDINAPDLYIPFMAFGTFIILAGFTLGFMGKFTPEAINLQFTRGLIGWGLQIVFLKGLLYSMGGGEVPLLDLVAYSGYLFAGLSLAIVARLLWAYSYYVMMPWMSLCMGIFLVRTMKRVIFTEMRGSERHSTRQHYFLLFMAIVQFPLFFWLGSIGA
uniref:YIF1b n=8 Tax=Triticinae TaxID=1648030 RepID=A0A452XBJ6_AEGTS